MAWEFYLIWATKLLKAKLITAISVQLGHAYVTFCLRVLCQFVYIYTETNGPKATTYSSLRTPRTLFWTPFHHTFLVKKSRGFQELLSAAVTNPQTSYQLVLATVEVMAVVEDIFICRVQAGFHTILYHLAGSWGALQFLHLPVNRRNASPGSCPPRWDILPSFLKMYCRLISPFPGLQTFPSVRVWMENIPHRLRFWVLSPQLEVLFWEPVKPLGHSI